MSSSITVENWKRCSYTRANSKGPLLRQTFSFDPGLRNEQVMLLSQEQKVCFVSRKKKSNRLKAANDAFNTNHSQKQVGIDFFFPRKLFILTYFVKATSFELTNVCRYQTQFYLRSILLYYVFSMMSH